MASSGFVVGGFAVRDLGGGFRVVLPGPLAGRLTDRVRASWGLSGASTGLPCVSSTGR